MVTAIADWSPRGLLEPEKPYGSIRHYGAADVTRVRFIKSAQRLGFSLDEIADLLKLDDGTQCDEASSLAEHKLHDIQKKPISNTWQRRSPDSYVRVIRAGEAYRAR